MGNRGPVNLRLCAAHLERAEDHAGNITDLRVPRQRVRNVQRKLKRLNDSIAESRAAAESLHNTLVRLIENGELK